MFRFNRKELECCALCIHNKNKKKVNFLPGVGYRCSYDGTADNQLTGNKCKRFELNIDMLEHVVYNRIAINLNLKDTCIIDEAGKFKLALAPLHIFIASQKQLLEVLQHSNRDTVKT